ncbi:BnaAnng41510D, partial [Brassica napus]
VFKRYVISNMLIPNYVINLNLFLQFHCALIMTLRKVKKKTFLIYINRVAKKRHTHTSKSDIEERDKRNNMDSSPKPNNDAYQHVFVMRHGDRIDNFEPLWVSTAARPWDPPLVQDGMIRAFRTGQRIRSQIPIHRVFVSPFLRCIQTASEVVSALSAVNVDPNAMSSKDVPSIDTSKLKVAIEYGLCEMLNSVAIRRELAPKDGNFDFRLSDLEAFFPEGMVDHNVDMVYKEMPKWEESVEGCRERYVKIVKALADKYPTENLLLVTHGKKVPNFFTNLLCEVTF